MRSLKRLLSLALATVFCICAAVYPIDASAKKAEYNEPFIHVGMYVLAPLLDTRVFSSSLKSVGGFDIGYTAGDEFVQLFSVTNRNIILLPQVNAYFENGKATADENGNIGAYSAVLGSFSSYTAAYNAAKAKNGFVAIVKGGYEARAYASTTAEGAKKASGGRSVASPSASGITVLDGNGNILFVFEDSARCLTLRGHGGQPVNLPMRHRSGSITNYDYAGAFEFSVSDGRLWMENIIGLEDYTKCVMANEIGTNYSVETRKAFAVLARTVALYAKHENRGFAVCTNSACCQVYHGLHRMSEENNAIVDSTRGIIATYNNSPIMVLYHNSNGGASCSSVAAWGNEVPYLTTVFQPEHEDGDKWQKVYTKQEFFKYLTSRNSFSALKDDEINMQILATDPYGSDYITVLSVSDGSGNTVTIETSEDIRSACGFTSANFELEYTAKVSVLTENGKIEQRDISGVLTADGYKKFDGFGDSVKTVMGSEITPDTVTVNGAGVGHGVGFSATGSEQLSKDGYSYKYILEFFFNGITLRTA